MAKLIYGINVTIDGCCEHTHGVPNDEVHKYFAELTRDAGALLYGRKTYELMVPFWPDYARDHPGQSDAISDFAAAFVSVPKIVVCSRSLPAVDNGKTTIIRSDLKEQVLKLKQEQNGPILTGGVDIPGQLIKLGLVDEMHLVVHPVIAGAGRRVAEDINLPGDMPMTLVASKVFASGHVAMVYAK